MSGLFETMIFGGPSGDHQERYATRAEALEGHKRAVHRAHSPEGKVLVALKAYPEEEKG